MESSRVAIIPAILPYSKRELEESLARLARASDARGGGPRTIQIDVIDGRFAAPASWPYVTNEHVSPGSVEGMDRFALDIDLMVRESAKAATEWLLAGAKRLTFHLASMEDPVRTIEHFKKLHGHEREGVRPFELGLAINLETDYARLAPLIRDIDYVQVMGIATIGRQGEPFDPRALAQVRAIRAAYPKLLIQVDGGVSETTAPALIEAGADRLIVGHAIVKAPEPARAWSAFIALAEDGARATSQPAHPVPSARYTETMLTEHELTALTEKANEIRQTIVEMLVAAGSGHTAGPLGMADIFTAFYFHILNHDPKHPDWEERDRLILSNGHIVPVRYAAMAHAGYFPVEECLTLRKFGSRLQGHPERMRLPGLETTSGPLGEGLSQAAGMALALLMDGGRPRIYCAMSDGEQEEGNIWEAVMFAGKNKLHNLTAVMDRNNIQIDGVTESVMPLEPLPDKYRAFNWHVIETNGNDIAAFIAAVEEAKAIYEKPTLIIAHTIPGKGVKEIEFDYLWHGAPPGAGPENVWPKAEQGPAMLRELRSLAGKVPHEYA